MIFLFLLLILLLFVLILLIRAARFVPGPEPIPSGTKIKVNRQKIIQDMQKLIRCRTVSFRDESLINQNEFLKFRELLTKLYPNIAGTCTRYLIDTTGIVYHWKGKNPTSPIVLMAHYDVVPVEESKWKYPPFDAVLKDDILWGRGTLDTKGTLCGILEAAEQLISEGFLPEHDIYFAFSGQEEVNGTTCASIVDWFASQNLRPAMVLDEGGAVVEHIFPGVSRECAVIGIAEKGITNIELCIDSGGGHASTPPPHTILGELSDAVHAIETHPFPRQLTKPVREMLDTLGRHSSFLYKILFANMWCFEGIFDVICKKAGGELNAMLRTTCAVTKMNGGNAFNVLPVSASAGMNLRLLGSDTVESARAYLEKVINNPNISVNIVEGRNPSAESDTSCEEWNLLCRTVADTWPGAIVSPYLMMACSDSWHYCRITDRVYRFSAMKLSNEERALIHGNNERVPVETLVKTVEFYVRLMKQL